MKFETIEEMTSYLFEYRNMYYELESLKEKTGISSPVFSDEMQTLGFNDKCAALNRDIERKNELMKEMQDRNDLVEIIHHINTPYYIMKHKFIDLESLEEIAETLHYSLSHVKQNLYPKAKRILFEECTKVYHDK